MVAPVDAGRLHKLARVLREVALDATSDPADGRPSAAEALVAMDIFEHSPTTVSEIVARTGVAQSQVSMIAAGLHDGGVVARKRDPSDGRRMLLTVPARARTSFGTNRGRRGITHALGAYLAGHGQSCGPGELAGVVRLLDELATRVGVAETARSRRR